MTHVHETLFYLQIKYSKKLFLLLGDMKFNILRKVFIPRRGNVIISTRRHFYTPFISYSHTHKRLTRNIRGKMKFTAWCVFLYFTR